MVIPRVGVTAFIAAGLTATVGASTNDTEYAHLQALAESSYETAFGVLSSTANSTCKAEDIVIRRSWDVFTADERKDYIRAVKCLQALDSITPSYLGSGIKTRFDDFVATHMNQTTTIHLTGNFLSCHRYFIWLYEQTLKNECAYNGSLPNWDWPLTAITGLEASPVYDGSETSMFGNAGSGGGCIYSGPFANTTVNLGPVSLALPGNISVTNPYNDTGIFSWKPRCLKRDLTDYIIQTYNSATQVLDTILLYDTISDFQLSLQGINITTGANYLGPHGGGHWSMGGDPGRDLFTSPGEPVFYLHHTMIDRVWWMWQMQSPAERTSGPSAIAGTLTFLNSPPSQNATIDDENTATVTDDHGRKTTISGRDNNSALAALHRPFHNDYNEYGYATGPPKQIKDLLSTTAGPFCYVYQ